MLKHRAQHRGRSVRKTLCWLTRKVSKLNFRAFILRGVHHAERRPAPPRGLKRQGFKLSRTSGPALCGLARKVALPHSLLVLTRTRPDKVRDGSLGITKELDNNLAHTGQENRL